MIAPVAQEERPWAERLTDARLRAGMRSRKELADRMGVNVSTIHAWEQGRRFPKGESWMALKRALPDAPSPLDLSVVRGEDQQDPGGYAVHLPMDPQRRLEVLNELMAMAIEDARLRRDAAGVGDV